jgi:succinoglycan biosynthesis protein ExoA
VSSAEIPLVAVLIPARNEVASIGRCLERVLAQDVPRGRLEVVVVDGDSDDGTGQIAEAILAEAGLARWAVHRNPGGSTPSNLNAGLALVRAAIVCRVDARSLIPPDYVRRCAEVLERRADVAVVGGAQVAVPRSDSTRDLGIARALNNRYGMGLSRYRRAASSGPADTVYLGAFRTAELRRAGGWDERFGTNQDFDLNRRMGANGAVWFEDGLEVGYLPRASLADLFRQYRRFGRWKARYWAMTGDRPQPRQLALLVGPGFAALIVSIGFWRRPRATVAAVAGVAIAVEAAGSRPVAVAEPAAHAVAMVALAAVSSGWWCGAVEGLVRQWAGGHDGQNPG